MHLHSVDPKDGTLSFYTAKLVENSISVSFINLMEWAMYTLMEWATKELKKCKSICYSTLCPTRKLNV
jgi:hypothetical protein